MTQKSKDMYDAKEIIFLLGNHLFLCWHSQFLVQIQDIMVPPDVLLASKALDSAKNSSLVTTLNHFVFCLASIICLGNDICLLKWGSMTKINTCQWLSLPDALACRNFRMPFLKLKVVCALQIFRIFNLTWLRFLLPLLSASCCWMSGLAVQHQSLGLRENLPYQPQNVMHAVAQHLLQHVMQLWAVADCSLLCELWLACQGPGGGGCGGGWLEWTW